MAAIDPRSGRSPRAIALAILLLTVLLPVAVPGSATAHGPILATAPDRAPGALGATRPVGSSAIARARAAAASDVTAGGPGAAVGQADGTPQVADAWIARPAITVPLPDPKTERRSHSTGAYQGRNHVWIPALGIDRSVASYACSRSTYPRDRVYRWGCAGSNNVYLFGHAHSVFKPLHDAYVRGRLRKGMRVFYADGAGRVREYSVRWWRVTRPDKGEFAYAAQARPSLTLQTCVGSKSQYRLIVRLVRV
jgi:hypothetical protein